MVTLGIQSVSVMGDGKQMLVVTKFVALVITSEQFCKIGGQSQTAAVDYLVGIFYGFLQICGCCLELGVCLGVGYGCYLIICKGIVSKYQICACQECLCSLL